MSSTPAKVPTPSRMSLDLSINKEDIFLVKKEQEIKRLESLIERKASEISSEKHKINENIEKIRKIMSKKFTKKGETIEVSNFLRETYSRLVPAYDIDHIRQSKNPARSKAKRDICCREYSIYKTISFSKSIIYNDEKYTLSNTKSDYKPGKSEITLLNEINKLEGKVFSLKIELNELEYQQIYVEYSDSYKVSIIKKIIETSDLKSLLLES